MHNSGKKEANTAEIRLLASALKLFSEKGYEGTSIREIIESAGVTRPVLYYYFQNKEALFICLVETKFNELIEKYREARNQPGSCRDRLQGIITKSFALAEQSPEAIQLLLQVIFSPPLNGPKVDQWHLQKQRFKLLEEIFLDGLENKEISGGDAQSLALAFLGLVDMYIMAKNNRPSVHLTRELGEGLAGLFFFGVQYRDHPLTALVSPYIA